MGMDSELARAMRVLCINLSISRRKIVSLAGFFLHLIDCGLL
jgi:hypothetical protein